MGIWLQSQRPQQDQILLFLAVPFPHAVGAQGDQFPSLPIALVSQTCSTPAFSNHTQSLLLAVSACVQEKLLGAASLACGFVDVELLLPLSDQTWLSSEASP